MCRMLLWQLWAFFDYGCVSNAVFERKIKKNKFWNAACFPMIAACLPMIAACLPMFVFYHFFWMDVEICKKSNCWPPQFCRLLKKMLRELPSRVGSSDTLLQGAALIRQTSMSLEGDELYQEMAARKKHLLDTWMPEVKRFCFDRVHVDHESSTDFLNIYGKVESTNIPTWLFFLVKNVFRSQPT